MPLDVIAQSFNAGVWSPRLDGRSDLEKYYSACRVSKNMIPTRYGPSERRPGLAYVAEVKDSAQDSRLLSFKFSTVQAYMLEMGDQYFRFFKDRGQILTGAGTEDISALDEQVAQWHMNEIDGTAVDDAVAVAPHDGTLSVDAAIVTETGKVGTGCFNLDGQYNITVADDAALSFDDSGDNPFSIVGWAFVTQQDNIQVLLSKWDETAGAVATEWRLSLTADRKPQLHLSDINVDLEGNVVGQWKLNDNAADTNVICSLPTYEIDGFDDGVDTVTITGDGDLTASFPDDSEFTIADSVANDGQYTVVSTAWGDPNFVITIAAASLTDADTTGTPTVAPHAGVASVNTDTFNATGKINGALDMGGSKYVIIDDSADFTFIEGVNGDFSILAWVYITPDSGNTAILSKWDDNVKREWTFKVQAALKLDFFIADQSVSKYPYARTDDELTLGWHLVGVTYNGEHGSWTGATAADYITFYVDGVAVASTATNEAAYEKMENLGGDIAIGSMLATGAPTQIWADKIDNVVVFDKKLSQADVLALWNDGSGSETMRSAEISAIADIAVTLGWHFFAATYDSTGGATAAGGIILYIDGAEVDSTNTDDATYTAMQADDSLVRIGAQESSGGVAEKFWGDKIDEMSLFSDVLTPAEIAGLYSTTPYEIPSPYLEADILGLQRIQSADIMYGFHPDYNPRKLKRFEHALWELEDIVFDWPPFVTENKTDTTITPSATVGTLELEASAPIFTAGHIGSFWLIKHDRRDNHTEKTLTAIATLEVLGDAADSYAAEGVTDIIVDVKGPYRFRTDSTTGSVWIGTLVLERSYDGLLTLVLDAAPADGAWEADDIITGATSGNTCVIVSVTDSTHYFIKQLSGSFTDGDGAGAGLLTNQSGNSRDPAATWPRYEGWHILETVQSAGNQDFNIAGNEELGDAYLRVRRTIDDADKDPTVTLSVERFYHYGIAKITGFTSAMLVTATTTRTIGSATATKTWSEGAWSDERGYPGAGTFHEERLMVGGTAFEPHRADGSKTDDWENFRAGTLDDDSISYSLATAELNAVRWLVSKEILLLGTSGAEWKLGSFDTGEPLTPGNPTVPRPQTAYGSKDIQAILLANIVLFVVGGQSESQLGRVVRGAQYVFEKGESGGYDAPDYTTLAEHITESGIVGMVYQQQPEPVLWCWLNNGNAIGMTFEPGQNVWGWFPLITDGKIKSMGVIPGVSEDEVWVIVERKISGVTKKYIEYMKPRDWGGDQKDCFFVDSGLTFDGGDAVTITGITQADPAVVTVDTYPTDGNGDNIADGDQVRIRYVGGMKQVNNKVFTVSNPDTVARTFELRDKLDEVDIDSSAFAAFAASITGDTTYGSEDITNVSTADIAKIMLGAPVTGTGIPDDTTITAIDNDRFTMSAEADFTDTTTITVGGTVEKVDNTFSGAGHLEAKTVSVLGDGSVHADVVVASGVVALTEYYNKVHIGLPYDSELMPMKLEAQTPSGTARGKIKRVPEIIFSFYNTLGCEFGTPEKTDTIPFRKTTDTTGKAVPLFTGEKPQSFPGGYELNGDVFVKQSQPLPLTVRSIISRLQLYG